MILTDKTFNSVSKIEPALNMNKMSILISLLMRCLIQLKFFPAALTSNRLAWKVRKK